MKKIFENITDFFGYFFEIKVIAILLDIFFIGFIIGCGFWSAFWLLNYFSK